MPQRDMEHEKDPKINILENIGSLEGIEIFNNQVLVAIYIRPQKTKSGIYLPEATVDEDKYQSKIGLVIKMGPEAFHDDDQRWFRDINIEENEWVIFRPSDGWSVTVNNVICRMISDIDVRGKVSSPDVIW